MPKHHHKIMRGGFWESWWNSTKKASSDAYNTVTGSGTPSNASTSPSNTTSDSVPTPSTSSEQVRTVGGRKRYYKRGGYTARMPINSVAAQAFPVHNIGKVPLKGGKTRRRRGGGTLVKALTPLTSDAAHAAPVHNIRNAQAHNWVGGRTKKRGGYTASFPITSTAANAAPVHNIGVHNYGGGRSRRRVRHYRSHIARRH